MTYTDKIILIAALILFWRGWNKGILRTVFGPIALVVCSVLSYFYYMWTRDLVIAAAIGIAAPIILNIIFSLLLNLLSGDKEKSVSIPSRLVAAGLNLIWGLFIFGVTAFTILLVPIQLPSLNKVQKDIQDSWTYGLIKPTIDEKLQKHHIKTIDPAKITALSDPQKMVELEKSSEYQSLVNDQRIKELLNDPTVGKLIEEKQIAQLMQHPKILELTRDPELLKKFLALYSKMLSDPAKNQ